MNFKINSTGNIILADQAFMDAVHPGDYTLLPDDALAVEPTTRHISVGAFFDRFGAQKYPILASSDAGVKALIADCSVRKYIDLDNPALPYGLSMLVAAGYAIDPAGVVGAVVADAELP